MAIDRTEIEALGSSLRRINQKLLKAGDAAHKQRIWYQGGEPYFDFFVETENDRVTWFQMTLRGRSISCSGKAAGLKTGSTNELNAEDESFYPASKTIQSDGTPDAEFVEMVCEILATRSGEDVFDQVLAILSHGN